MSSWDMEYPPPERRRAFGGGLRLLLALGALALCGLLSLGVIVWRIAVPSGDPAEWSANVESREEKYAAVAAAFNGDSVGADRRRLKSIRRLFSAIVQATEANDHTAFARQINAGRLFSEMKRSGVMRPISQIEQWMAMPSVRADLQVPVNWVRYELARVDFPAGGEEAVVYGRFFSADGEEYPVRWWIVRGAGGWKAYDWDLLDYGIRASKEEAIYYVYQHDARLHRYFTGRQMLHDAGRLIDEGDYEHAKEMIRDAEGLRVLPLLSDDLRLQIGNLWLAGGCTNEAIAAYRRVADPDAAPGTLHGLAVAYSHRGQYERALEFAARYETLLGRSADLSGMTGEWLLELERPDEAAAQLERSLELDPDQLDRLALLGFALDDDRKEELVGYVRRAADPVQTAEMLGRDFACGGHYTDLAALEVVGRMLAEIAPSSPEKFCLEGLAAEVEGDDAAAASFFAQAFAAEDDAEKKAGYVGSYLEAMASAGRAVEGYLHAPDPMFAFGHLAELYEYEYPEVAKETFQSLLDEHRRRCPDDARIDCHRGNLLSEEERYAEAERAYAAAAAKTGEETLLSNIRYGRVRALYGAGAGTRAYDEIEPAEETIRQLADLYLAEQDPKKLAKFERLLQMHRARCPDDPWLDFHAASLARKREDFQAADRLFARGQQGADEDYVASAYRTNRLETRIESGDVLGALGEVDPPEETFAYLARHLAATRQWSRLESLLERYRRIDPSSAELRYWEVGLLWQRKDYEGVVQLLTPWPEGIAQEITEWRASELREKLVRCHLRLGRVAAAETAAQAAYEARGEWLPVLLVSAAKGDVSEASGHLGQGAASWYAVTGAYFDEDAGAVLWGDDFQSTRRRYPPELPHDRGGVSLVVLFDEARPPDADWLMERFEPVVGHGATIAGMPERLRADTRATTLAVTARSGGVFHVTFGADRLRCDAEFEPSWGGPPLERAVADHEAWIAVDAAASNHADEDAEFSTVCRLVAALADEHALAVYVADDARLIALDRVVRHVLGRPNPHRLLAKAGREAWLYRAADEDDEDSEAAVTRRLNRLFSTFDARQADDRLLVNVHLSLGFATESHWLEIWQVAEGPRGRRRLFAEFTADSQLVPEFRRGAPVVVRTYSVLDWKVEREESGETARAGL